MYKIYKKQYLFVLFFRDKKGGKYNMKNNEIIQNLMQVNINSTTDALVMKKKILMILRELTLTYSTESLERQNIDLTNYLPAILSILAKVQGSDIICNVGTDTTEVKTVGHYIESVNHARNHSMNTLKALEETLVKDQQLLNTKAFSSDANIILVKKQSTH